MPIVTASFLQTLIAETLVAPSEFYPYDVLRQKPSNLDLGHLVCFITPFSFSFAQSGTLSNQNQKEAYLSDAEFEEVFHMTRENFYSAKKWYFNFMHLCPNLIILHSFGGLHRQQIKLKRAAGLL
jgi:hypothetical protein